MRTTNFFFCFNQSQRFSYLLSKFCWGITGFSLITYYSQHKWPRNHQYLNCTSRFLTSITTMNPNTTAFTLTKSLLYCGEFFCFLFNSHAYIRTHFTHFQPFQMTYGCVCACIDVQRKTVISNDWIQCHTHVDILMRMKYTHQVATLTVNSSNLIDDYQHFDIRFQ